MCVHYNNRALAIYSYNYIIYKLFIIIGRSSILMHCIIISYIHWSEN